MKLVPIGVEEASDGVFGVLYGDTGVGKTASCIQSMPKPLLIIEAEARNVNIQARAVGVKPTNPDGSVNYIVAKYENFVGLTDFIGDIENLITKESAGIDYADIKSILVDGVTQLTVNLKDEVADYATEKREENKRNFISDVKVSEEGYGVIATRMLRVTRMLSDLSANDGKIVVMTVLLGAEKSWKGFEEGQRAFPEFVGRMYGRELPGMCDFIGMVERRFENVEVVTSSGEKIVKPHIVFPPMVKFETIPGEDFLCKWAGKRREVDGVPVERMEGVLDLGKIIGLITAKD